MRISAGERDLRKGGAHRPALSLKPAGLGLSREGSAAASTPRPASDRQAPRDGPAMRSSTLRTALATMAVWPRARSQSKIRSFRPEVDNATADPAHLQRLAEDLCSKGKLRWTVDVADPIGQILGQPKGFFPA